MKKIILFILCFLIYFNAKAGDFDHLNNEEFERLYNMAINVKVNKNYFDKITWKEAIIIYGMINTSGSPCGTCISRDFINKLNEARNNESLLLKDYIEMRDSEAFILFIQDLKRANIETKDEVIDDIWGENSYNYYVNNIIMDFNLKEWENTAQKVIGNLGSEENYGIFIEKIIEEKNIRDNMEYEETLKGMSN